MSPQAPYDLNPTPQTSSTSLTQSGNRASFISGEEIDIFKLRTETHEDGAVSTQAQEEATRRRTSVKLEMEDAWSKGLKEEESLRNQERTEEDDEPAEIKAKRDAEAKKRAKRAKRDHERKARRKREQEEAEEKKLDDEQRVKREAEEAEQREKDRLEREEEEHLQKVQEEEDRRRIEAEEKEKARVAEIEAKRVAEEAKKKAEEDAKRAAEEETRRKAEEENTRKEEEEAKLQAEAEQKAKQDEEAKQREEQEAATVQNASASAQPVDSASQSSTLLGSTPAYDSSTHSTRDLSESASALPPSRDPTQKRPIPGRLDLSSASASNLPQLLPSVLASARFIDDIGKVSYPEGIKAPSSELNLNATSGQFR